MLLVHVDLIVIFTANETLNYNSPKPLNRFNFLTRTVHVITSCYCTFNFDKVLWIILVYRNSFYACNFVLVKYLVKRIPNT